MLIYFWTIRWINPQIRFSHAANSSVKTPSQTTKTFLYFPHSFIGSFDSQLPILICSTLFTGRTPFIKFYSHPHEKYLIETWETHARLPKFGD